MENRPLEIDPEFFYGTAWKEDLTESCVFNALSAGYRAIDTANQRKHYYEEGVGMALARAYSESGLSRRDIFLQTKFTFSRGQDHRKPYDETAPFNVQVKDSFASSLLHLRTDYIDSFVLHGPSTPSELADADWETWSGMEEICRSGKARYLGISNVSLEQLIGLYEGARIKPSFVQNRCFADTCWDRDVREFCSSKGIFYQGFSLLTANSRFLAGNFLRPEGRNVPELVFSDESDALAAAGLHPEVAAILRATGMGIQPLIFRFAQQIGIIPVTGTRSPAHMKSNLRIGDLVLNESQLKTIENVAFLE